MSLLPELLSGRSEEKMIQSARDMAAEFESLLNSDIKR